MLLFHRTEVMMARIKLISLNERKIEFFITNKLEWRDTFFCIHKHTKIIFCFHRLSSRRGEMCRGHKVLFLILPPRNLPMDKYYTENHEIFLGGSKRKRKKSDSKWLPSRFYNSITPSIPFHIFFLISLRFTLNFISHKWNEFLPLFQLYLVCTTAAYL